MAKQQDPKLTETRVAMAEGVANAPEGSRPWEDRTLSSAERYDSYDRVVVAHAEGIVAAMTRAGITEGERTAIRLNPETEHWVSELRQLQSETPEDFCYRIDEGVQRELLGKNFLGAEAWKQGFGVDVGVVPPLPEAITKELLNSDCPLHPGQKIKDSHLLVLMPQTVNGEPYSALKLDQLCATRKETGNRLIYDGAERWKSQGWAAISQPQSEWVLMPKSDPDPDKVPIDKHFRSKNINEQEDVHKAHYGEYREVRSVELMTAVLLYDLVNKERLVPDYLRCKEPNASGGRVCVGLFNADGLRVLDAHVASVNAGIGRALAWKLKT